MTIPKQVLTSAAANIGCAGKEDCFDAEQGGKGQTDTTDVPVKEFYNPQAVQEVLEKYMK